MFNRRIIILALILCAAYLCLAARLVQLQVVNHDFYMQRRADSSRWSYLETAKRGVIKDRNGIILAEDVLSYDIGVQPGKLNVSIDLKAILDEYNETAKEKCADLFYNLTGNEYDDEAQAAMKRISNSPWIDVAVVFDDIIKHLWPQINDEFLKLNSRELNEADKRAMLLNFPTYGRIGEIWKEGIANARAYADKINEKPITDEQWAWWCKVHTYREAKTEMTAISRDLWERKKSDLQAARLELETNEPLVEKISILTGRTKKHIAKGMFNALMLYARGWVNGNTPVVVVYDIKWELWCQIYRNQTLMDDLQKNNLRKNIDFAMEDKFPAIRAMKSSLRNYPLGNGVSHIIGYLGSLNAEEVRNLKRAAQNPKWEGNVAITDNQLQGPDKKRIASSLMVLNKGERDWIADGGQLKTDLVGRAGIERVYNEQLRGKHGRTLVHRTSDGPKKIRVAEPERGADIKLTLDSELQIFCNKRLENRFKEIENERKINGDTPISLPSHCGSVVVMNPHTGEIIALASVPSYNSSALTPPLNSAEIKAMQVDKDKPQFFRAIKGRYQLGSIFKSIVATAGLSTSVISKETNLTCDGFVELGQHRFRCWLYRHHRVGHGPIPVKTALEVSCNCFFFHLGEKLGGTRMLEGAEDFGFGIRTGIDLPAEDKGNLPGKKRRGKRNYLSLGDIYNFSIGQGALGVTPLQVAVAMSAIVNDGKILRPYLVEKNNITGRTPPFVERKLNATPRQLAIIREGLWLVVNGERGSARKLQTDLIEFAGKTSTAETRKNDKFPHGWFAGFAPYKNPKWVVVCMIERSGSGGKTAGPVVRDILSFLAKRELGINVEHEVVNE